MATAEQMKDLIAARVPGAVDIVEENPCFVTSISMLPLGELGLLMVYKNANGALKALPIPFGLYMNASELGG